jgi:hypothetical protein
VLCVLRSLVVSIFVIVILRCHLTNPFFLPSLHFLLVVGYCASDCWDPPSSAPRFLVGCWVLRLGLLGSALLGSSVAPPRLFGARLVLFAPSGLLLGAPHETLRPVLLLLRTKPSGLVSSSWVLRFSHPVSFSFLIFATHLLSFTVLTQPLSPFTYSADCCFLPCSVPSSSGYLHSSMLLFNNECTNTFETTSTIKIY